MYPIGSDLCLVTVAQVVGNQGECTSCGFCPREPRNRSRDKGSLGLCISSQICSVAFWPITFRQQSLRSIKALRLGSYLNQFQGYTDLEVLLNENLEFVVALFLKPQVVESEYVISGYGLSRTALSKRNISAN